MGRTIFKALGDQLVFSGGRFYNTLYHSQYTGRFWFVVGLSAVVYTRYRAETGLGYHINITDYDVKEEDAKKKDKQKGAVEATVYKPGVQHRKVYLNEDTTVGQFKKTLINGAHPKSAKVRIGCKGRVMSDDDNLANAVRCFCRRDPRLVAWIEDFE